MEGVVHAFHQAQYILTRQRHAGKFGADQLDQFTHATGESRGSPRIADRLQTMRTHDVQLGWIEYIDDSIALMVKGTALHFIFCQRCVVAFLFGAHLLPEFHRQFATFSRELIEFVQLSQIRFQLLRATAMAGHHHGANFVGDGFCQNLSFDGNNFGRQVGFQTLNSRAFNHLAVFFNATHQRFLC